MTKQPLRLVPYFVVFDDSETSCFVLGCDNEAVSMHTDYDILTNDVNRTLDYIM